MARMGRPTVSAARVNRAADLVKRGVTVSDAARACGVSRQTLTRYGVQRGRLKGNGVYRVRPEHRPYGETMMDVLLEAVPDSLPIELRDEITQQLAVEILNGDKVFRLLRERAIEIKRQVIRAYYNRFQMQSLSQPIGENGLTLEDVLEG